MPDTTPHAIHVTLACAALLLGGCASNAGNYPSLAVRDVERAEGQFETVAPARIEVPSVGIDLTGDLPARLGSLVNNAEAAHREFVSSSPDAQRLVAAGAGSAVGSDSWAAAQVALANLDSARSQTAIALGDLDILAIAAAVEGVERTQIEAARQQVIALVGEEDALLERLRARMR